MFFIGYGWDSMNLIDIFGKGTFMQVNLQWLYG